MPCLHICGRFPLPEQFGTLQEWVRVMKFNSIKSASAIAAGLLLSVAFANKAMAISPDSPPLADINVVFTNVGTTIDDTYGAFYFADGSVYLESLGSVSGSVTKIVNFTGDNAANPLGAIIIGDYGTSFFQNANGILPPAPTFPGVTLGATNAVVSAWTDSTSIGDVAASVGAATNVDQLFFYIENQAAEGYLSGSVVSDTPETTFVKDFSTLDYIPVDGAAGSLANFNFVDPSPNGGVSLSTGSAAPLPAPLWAALAGMAVLAIRASRRSRATI